MDDTVGYQYAKLAYDVVGFRSLAEQHRIELKDFIAVAIPGWAEGEEWVAETVQVIIDAPGYNPHEDKQFVAKYHGDIVGRYDEVHVSIAKVDNFYTPDPARVFIELVAIR